MPMATAKTNANANANARRAGSTSAVWGYVIVICAGLSFVLSMYTMFLSKLGLFFMEKDQDNEFQLLPAIERDVYYCYLVPLTIPVTILAFYANWVSLKFFRHN